LCVRRLARPTGPVGRTGRKRLPHRPFLSTYSWFCLQRWGAWAVTIGTTNHWYMKKWYQFYASDEGSEKLQRLVGDSSGTNGDILVGVPFGSHEATCGTLQHRGQLRRDFPHRHRQRWSFLGTSPTSATFLKMRSTSCGVTLPARQRAMKRRGSLPSVPMNRSMSPASAAIIEAGTRHSTVYAARIS